MKRVGITLLMAFGLLAASSCSTPALDRLREPVLSPAQCYIDAECPKGQRCESPERAVSQGVCVREATQAPRS